MASNTSYPGLLPDGFPIYQGATVDRTFYYRESDETTVVSLSDVTEATFTLRSDVKAAATIIDLTTTPNSNGSRVYIDGALGTVRVLIADEDTKNFPELNGAFDIFLTYSDGVVECFLYGPAPIRRRVGRR